ncbi:MAG: FAD-binding oxidoreductase, partial [Desulfobacterales bacterium]|nr:FAD-binding oxidoreductase [Desulfobacterales bacterium]
MSEKSDIVIIGGGVMGCAIAYNLAKEGLKPVVIEKSDI